jgi:hypothetical protein
MKKEYDILYVNGCSFTVGHHLKDKFTWPTLLQNKLDIPMINDARNANSMKTILNVTVSRILENTNKNILCVIGLTWPGRCSIQYDNIFLNAEPEGIINKSNRLEWIIKFFSERYVTNLKNEIELPYHKYQYNQISMKREAIKDSFFKPIQEIYVNYGKYLKSLIKYDKEFNRNQLMAYWRQIMLLDNFLYRNKIDYCFVDFLPVSRLEHYRKVRDFIDHNKIIDCSDVEINPKTGHPSIMACKEISNEILHFFFENKYISNYLIS